MPRAGLGIVLPKHLRLIELDLPAVLAASV